MKLVASDILIVQPATSEDIDMLADDIKKVAQYLPEWEPDFLQGMRMFPDQFILIYYRDEIVAYAEINDNTSFDHLGKDTLEFSGAIIPEYRSCGLIQSAAKLIIKDAFRRTGKKKMLSFVPMDHPAAEAALKMLGFRHIGKTQDKLKYIYAIKRSEALTDA